MRDELFWGNPAAQARFHVGQRVTFRDRLLTEPADATIVGIDWDRTAGPLLLELASGEQPLALPWEVETKFETIEQIEAFLRS